MLLEIFLAFASDGHDYRRFPVCINIGLSLLDNIVVEAPAKAFAACYHNIGCCLNLSVSQKIFLGNLIAGVEQLTYGVGNKVRILICLLEDGLSLSQLACRYQLHRVCDSLRAGY